VGSGLDAHRFSAGRALVLCGVRVDHPLGLSGHSDADVAAHALMDALLGAAGLGDIGEHFPDSDAAYAGASSMDLLRRVAGLLEREGWTLTNADVTIVCEQPRIAALRQRMRDTVAAALGVSVDLIAVKATTTEGMGFTGRGEGIAAHAVCLVSRPD
jgi:2-C-methyl-D-erythritol 2,4-cyclodiphosphate synthase